MKDRGTFLMCAVGAAALAGVIATGCGSSEGGDEPGQADASSQSAADARPQTTADAQTTPTPDAATQPSPDAGTTTAMATVSGIVTRSVAPSAGGVGNLVVAMFDEDPATNMNQPVAGIALIADADMSGAGAMIAYEIVDVLPRSEPYFIVAFLDDNGTTDFNDPPTVVPDTGDLISLMGFGSPTITVSSAGSVTMDLDLNLAVPF